MMRGTIALWRARAGWLATCAWLAPMLAGCVMIGPDYHQPPAPVSEQWIDADGDGTIRAGPVIDTGWWKVFERDPFAKGSPLELSS